MALFRAIGEGGKPKTLLTMLHEEGQRSRSHGLPVSVLQAQADSLRIPLMTRNATWDDYESVFIDALRGLKGKGIGTGVFGDIDLEEHRQWVHKVCAATDVEPIHPLWGKGRRSLLDDLLRAGFRATIVAVKERVLDESYLGRELTEKTVEDLHGEGIDVSGEAGEYHTVVTDGPIFANPIILTHGRHYSRDSYVFLDVGIAGK
jgi:uncharacterized protein (TIGR00290 family)